jgi:protein-disulfide isomerase
MKPKWDSVTNGILLVCALSITALVIKRELFATPTPVRGEQKSILISDWENYRRNGSLIGPLNAEVQLMEFADFECPYCRAFRNSLKAVDARHPGHIALTYVHFPIAGHRFALPAARVAECAGEQGKFEAMHDQLFEEQDKFGLKPWDEYATAAGVPDLQAFDTCVKKTDAIPRLEAGKALGAKLDVKGTPTIIINGWKLGHPPSESELDQMVQRVLGGKSPVDGKS